MKAQRLAGETPALLGVLEAGEGIHDGVEIGRDRQAEMLEVVGGVDDHR